MPSRRTRTPKRHSSGGPPTQAIPGRSSRSHDDVPAGRAMKAPLRSLGLALVVLAATACSPRFADSVQPRTTPTPMTIRPSCAHLADRTPCPIPVPAPTPSSASTIEVSDITFSDAMAGWAVGTSCVDNTQTCTVIVDKTSNAGATWSRPISLGQFQNEGSPGGWSPLSVNIRFVGANIWSADRPSTKVITVG